MKKVFIIILLAVIGYSLADTFVDIPFGENRIGEIESGETVAGYYLSNTVEKSKVANVITAIVVNYRGLDTLGEVTVLFLATTGLASILYRRKEEEEDAQRLSLPSSRIMRTGARVLFPTIVLLGIYVFIHGHLTPGGGFQGGTIVATGFLLMLISYKGFNTDHNIMVWIESLAGLSFVGIGIWGLLSGNTFLENSTNVGVLNSLISGGLIPVIYIVVGFKVAVELTGILDILLKIKPKK
ncbi:MAG: hydrogen gas-evolving membrane-bound hydrogenase subunit E [Bacteroidota bacterium]